MTLPVIPALLLSHARGQPPLARAAAWQGGFGFAEALRWAVPAAIAALFAGRANRPALRGASAATATLLACVAAAQVTRLALLPLLPAAGRRRTAGAVARRRRR